MNSTARLLTAPKTTDGVRLAEAVLEPGGAKIYIRFMPSTAGDYQPFARGNRVLVAITHDDPDAGAYVLQRFTTPPTPRNAGNREIHAATDRDLILVARSGDAVLASESKRVLLGAEDDSRADYQAVALIDKLRADVVSLQQQIDGLIANLNTAITGAGPLVPGVPLQAGAWTTALQGYATPLRVPNGVDPTHEGAPTLEAAFNVAAKPEDPLP